MQSVSLLAGLGASPLVQRFLDPTHFQSVTTSEQLHVAYYPKGTCTQDGTSIYDITAEGDGYWRRIKVGEQCLSTVQITNEIRDHRGEPNVLVPPSNLQSGTAPMIEVGPFKFALDTERSAFSWWGPKLPQEWQDIITHAWGEPDSGGSRAAMVPGFAMYFTTPPSNYDVSYVGLGRTLSPTWKPIAKATHPTSGKDYGVFLSITPRYSDRPMNDPENVVKLDFVWAPITRSLLGKVWEWIKTVVAKVTNFVCDQITDPAMAATVGMAATAGGPIAIGATTGAMLLCGPADSTPSTPTDAQPAITPKKPWWPWAIGGLAFVGLLTYLLIPPKPKTA